MIAPQRGKLLKKDDQYSSPPKDRFVSLVGEEMDA